MHSCAGKMRCPNAIKRRGDCTAKCRLCLLQPCLLRTYKVAHLVGLPLVALLLCAVGYVGFFSLHSSAIREEVWRGEAVPKTLRAQRVAAALPWEQGRGGQVSLITHSGKRSGVDAAEHAASVSGWLKALVVPSSVSEVVVVVDDSRDASLLPRHSHQGVPIVSRVITSSEPFPLRILREAARQRTDVVLLVDPFAPASAQAMGSLAHYSEENLSSIVGPITVNEDTPSSPNLNFGLVALSPATAGILALEAAANPRACPHQLATQADIPQKVVSLPGSEQSLLVAFSSSPSTVLTGNVKTDWVPQDPASAKSPASCPPMQEVGSTFGAHSTASAMSPLPTVLSAPSKHLRVFVYDMPAEFGSNLLAAAQHRSGKTNKCSSSFYASEQRVHEYLMSSHWRVQDPALADLFYVPVYVACAVKSGLRVQLQQEGASKPGFAPDFRALRSLMHAALAHIRREYPFWDMSGGRDHVWTFTQGAGAAVFGEALWDEVQHSIFLTTNGQLSEKHFRFGHDIVIPSFMSRKPGILAHDPLSSPPSRDTAVYWGGSLMEDRRYSRGMRHALVDAFNAGELAGDVLVEVSAGAWRDTFTAQLSSRFCLALEGWWAWTPRPFESVLQGCVPALVSNDIVLPFQRFLPWDTFSLKLSPTRGIKAIVSLLRAIQGAELRSLQAGVLRHWRAFHWTAPYGQAGAYLGAELLNRVQQLKSERMLATSQTWLPLQLSAEWGVPVGVPAVSAGLIGLDSSTQYILQRTMTCAALKAAQRQRCDLSGRTHCFKEELSPLIWQACPDLDFGFSSLQEAIRLGGDVRSGAASQPVVRTIQSSTGDAVFVITPHLHVGHAVTPKAGEEPSNGGLCLATQLSVDRLQNLLDLVEKWNGPVSAAVLLQGSSWSHQRILEVIRRRPRAAKWLSLHVVVQLGAGVDSHRVYPVNMLRSIAQQLASEHMVLVLDADVVPSADMEGVAAALAAAQTAFAGEQRDGSAACRPGKDVNSDGFNAGPHNPLADTQSCAGLRAFVLPSFEGLKNSQSATSVTTREALRSKVMDGTMSPMHAYYPRAYFPVDYGRWVESTDDSVYTVPYSPHFEPYVIVPRYAPLPNASFIQRGLNKAQWAYHLHAAGYSFTVLQGVFCVDVPTGFTGQRPRMVGVFDLWERMSQDFHEHFGVVRYNHKNVEAVGPFLRQVASSLPWADKADAFIVKRGGARVSKATGGGASADLERLHGQRVLSVYLRVCAPDHELVALVEHYCGIPLVNDVTVSSRCGQVPRWAADVCPAGSVMLVTSGRSSKEPVTLSQMPAPAYVPLTLPSRAVSSFYPPSLSYRTDCVLHVEDNVKLSVQDIAALHSAWIQNPNVHVGLNPLFIQVPSVTEDESQWSAHKVDPLSLAAAYNSMQLNASLLHADWLQLFSRLDSEVRSTGLQRVRNPLPVHVCVLSRRSQFPGMARRPVSKCSFRSSSRDTAKLPRSSSFDKDMLGKVSYVAQSWLL